MPIRAPLILLLMLSGLARAQQTAVPTVSSSVRSGVMQAIAAHIVAQNREASHLLVGVPRWCDSLDGDKCVARAFTKEGAAEAGLSAAALAVALHMSASVDLEADRRALVSSAGIDSTKPKNQRYRFCPPGPFVLAIAPSTIRETKAGKEWHVVVVVTSDPLRGECLGGGTTSDFVVQKNGAESYVVTSTRLLGSGDGHVR